LTDFTVITESKWFSHVRRVSARTHPFVFGKAERRRPSNCPQRRADVVKSIVYGLPMEEEPAPVEERGYVIGGCVLRMDSPSWYCGARGHKWRSE
jgi:hypothetical protein